MRGLKRSIKRARSVTGVTAPERPTAAPADDVGYQLKRLGAALRPVLDSALRRAGLRLSMAHVAALFELEEHSGATGAALARLAMVTAQAMNTVLHRLEQEGCVARTVQPHNRRADCWSLTVAGRAQLARARSAGQPVFRRMLAPLAPAEQAQLRGLLARCVAALEGGEADTGAADAGSRRRPVRRDAGRGR